MKTSRIFSHSLVIALSLSLSACGLSAPPSAVGSQPSSAPSASPEDEISRVSIPDFSFLYPQISSFDTDGVPDNTLLIIGSNFGDDKFHDGVTQILFVELDGEDIEFVLNSDSLITATLPDGVTSGTIEVRRSFLGSGSASFDATPEPTETPVVSALSDRVGMPGDSFVVFGENLLESSSVTIGGVDAEFTVIDDGSLSVTVPANAAEGPVTVTNAGGSDSSDDDYLLAEVTSFSPASALIGETVTITGSGFSDLSNLSVGGAESNYSVVSDTQITLKVPGAAETGSLVLYFSNGGNINAGSLTVSNAGFFVKADASGSNDGSNWDNAYTNLQSALDAASSGDEIWVSAGTHTPADASQGYTLVSGVSVYGGFLGDEKDRDERDWQNNSSVLSCDISGNDDYSDGSTDDLSDNCATVMIGADNAVLDGFTIQGGNTNQQGGGMYNLGVSPTLNNVTFQYNTAEYGGGLFNTSSASPSLNNVKFISNTAKYGGGMANFSNSEPSLEEVSFTSNQATRHGGGMYNHLNSSPSLKEVTFEGNAASNFGGGLYNNNSSNPSLEQVYFISNTATDYGGGLYNFASAPTLNQVVFDSNSAEQGGGVYIKDGSAPVLKNIVFSGNTATSFGGAVYHYESTASFNHVSFMNNTSQEGGAFYQFTDNASEATVANSLFWQSDIVSYTLDSSLGNIEASFDPYLDSSNPKGADGNWLSADDSLQLNGSSEGIDAGLLTADSPLTDILGNARVGNPDAGAYEYSN